MVETQRPERLPLDLTLEAHIPADRSSIAYRRGLKKITGAIVAATGSFNWALIFSAILVVIGIINYLFLMGKIEPINDKGGKSPVLNAAEQH